MPTWKVSTSSEFGPLSQTDVDLIIARMLQSGASWSMILRSISDTFNSEAEISLNDDRRRSYENARDGVDDAEAEMLEMGF